MTSVFESKKVCATIFFLFAMSVAATTFAGGSLPSFGSHSVLTPDAQMEQALKPFPPDPWDDTIDQGPPNRS